jgi:hypothetical protein
MIRRERERKVKGEIRERGKRQPNSSPNFSPKLCEWFSGRLLLKGRGTRTVPSLRGKSLKPGNRAQRKVDYTNYYAITTRRTYHLVYQSHRKVEIYRDTGVSKNSFVINSNYQSLYRPNKGDLDSLIKLRLGLWSL